MPVDFTVRDRIATMTLDAPEAMNSLDPDMRAAMFAGFRRVQEDDDIRVLIITGAGDKAFCTGANLKKTLPPKESYAELNFGRAKDESNMGLGTDKPVIAALNGWTLGGGLELALLCDLRFAADTARLGLPEARRATIPGAGGTQRLPRELGIGKAMYMMLTGDHIDAAEAYRVGLVQEVFPAADLQDKVFDIARKIADNGPLAIRVIKRLVYQGLESSLEAGLNMERMAFGVMRDTKDRIEGRIAFAEKRPPVYRGE